MDLRTLAITTGIVFGTMFVWDSFIVPRYGDTQVVLPPDIERREIFPLIFALAVIGFAAA